MRAAGLRRTSANCFLAYGFMSVTMAYSAAGLVSGSNPWGGYNEFSRCSDFGGCGAVGLATVEEAAGVAGADECACCAGTLKVWDQTDGTCAGAPIRPPSLASAS